MGLTLYREVYEMLYIGWRMREWLRSVGEEKHIDFELAKWKRMFE